MIIFHGYPESVRVECGKLAESCACKITKWRPRKGLVNMIVYCAITGKEYEVNAFGPTTDEVIEDFLGKIEVISHQI